MDEGRLRSEARASVWPRENNARVRRDAPRERRRMCCLSLFWRRRIGRGEGSVDKTRVKGWPIFDENAEIQMTTNYECRISRAGKLTHFARSSSALLPLFLPFFFLLFFPFSSSFFSSYGAGWMTSAENSGFLMALLFAHFISSRVHQRVTRAHRLADSLPCTRILKNNSACLYILRKSGLWNLTGGARYTESWSRIKQRTQTNTNERTIKSMWKE